VRIAWARRCGAVLVLLIASGMACSTGVEDRASRVDLSFYLVPTPLPLGKPGALIRRVRVPAPHDSTAWAILYHSRSAAGRDIAVSGFLVAPNGPPPLGGYPVVSLAHGTTGLADTCAPSRAAFTGSLVADPIITRLVGEGFAVAATDYEGLGVPGPHPYLVGESEGRSVLDAARAAMAFPGVRISNRVLLFGYSQGGQAVLWAAQVAKTYASEVHVIGAVAVAPVGELVEVAAAWAGSEDGAPFLLAALDSWSGYYGVSLDTVLGSRGERARVLIRERCFDRLSPDQVGESLFRGNPMASGTWSRLARENTPTGAPHSIPILIQQGDADELIPPATNVALVNGLCLSGAAAELRVYPGARHSSVLGRGLTNAIAWMRQRLTGHEADTRCGA
jgi:pimeloyl-ACP methyl ester carboxylesterase